LGFESQDGGEKGLFRRSCSLIQISMDSNPWIGNFKPVETDSEILFKEFEVHYPMN
jgi:hypothetical protein